MSGCRHSLTVLFFEALLSVCVSAAEPDKRLIRETNALSPEAEEKVLHAPQGFTVHLFASEPMINKPINMAFDARGRLWVSSTTEYPYAADKKRWSDPQGTRVKHSRDAIKILEDTDGDGRADKVTDFADGLNIPTGVLPWHKPEHKSGCIAFSIPNIWYFADTDGDGRCDKREVLFGPLGYEKDTHGMCSSFRLGLDGWVYATHGFSNTSHFKAKDGSTLDLHSGNVFRFRPDGSAVEKYTSGQVNPFGLAWDRYGNLYSADCHSSPVYQLIRGACYPSFGKPHDGLGFAPVMCQHSHGSTGICGIVYLDGGVWGPEWDDHILLGNCVTSRVNHDHVTFTGSTPKANEQPDFITSDDPWFRPVDLQLGPDGALYIADFYNKIIGHYEVTLDHPGRDKERGRIWRVVQRGASPHSRWRPADEKTHPIEWLQAPDPRRVRATAAFYSKHPLMDAFHPLLAAFDRCDSQDISLRHQLKLALREHLKLPGAFASVSNNAKRLVAEIAKAVPTADAASFLFDEWKSGRLADPPGNLLGIIARHGSPNVIEQALSEARKLEPTEAVGAVSAMHNGHLERGVPPPPALLAWATELAKSLLAAQQSHASEWTSLPHSSHPAAESPWCLEERKCANGRAVTVISSLDKEQTAPERLTGILRSKAFPAPAKLSFWLCGHQGFPKDNANEKNLVRLVADDLPQSGTPSPLSGTKAPDARTAERTLRITFPPRSDVCQRVEWDLADLKGRQVALEIVDGDNGPSYAWLGITRIEPAVVSIESFTSGKEQDKQLRTLATILRTTAPVGLRDKLAPFLPKPAAAPAPPQPRPELDALIAARVAAFSKAKPDTAKGKQIFTTSCATCHQIKGQGGLIGPQLDGISTRGAARLIEDILDPNRNVDVHFHLHQLKLRDGSTLVGFVRSEVGQVTILVDIANNEQRIAKGDIIEDKNLPQSLMPPTFGQTLPEKDLADLLAWLLKH